MADVRALELLRKKLELVRELDELTADGSGVFCSGDDADILDYLDRRGRVLGSLRLNEELLKQTERDDGEEAELLRGEIRALLEAINRKDSDAIEKTRKTVDELKAHTIDARKRGKLAAYLGAAGIGSHREFDVTK